MLKKRISKIAFVLACIISLLMPYTTPVLAAALTSKDTTAELQVLIMHEGGDESSNTLTDKQKEYYDTTPYGYKVGDTRVFKIITKGDTDYENVFYCLNAKKSFPGVTAQGYNSLTYTNVADLKDSTDTNVKSLHLSTSYNDDSEKWTNNYKSLIWLIDNSFTKNAANQKDAYLAKAFANYTDYDLETVKALLTDDDIDVVQQYAMWYFTNNDSAEFNTEVLLPVTLTKHDLEAVPPVEVEGTYNDLLGSTARQDIGNHLYQYLVNEAKKGAETVKVTYPEITTLTPGVTVNDEYFVVGPFNVKSGTALPADYSLKVEDQNANEIARNQYEILIEGEDSFTTKNVTDIFDKNYYIYLPKTNKTVTDVSLSLNYTKYETKATLWKNNSVNDEGVEVYQPVVLITKESEPHAQTVKATINRDEADLALRKYIIKVNDKVVNRQPEVDVTGLKNETSTTAVYKHAKNPVKVTNGDRVVYEIRVYNEADIAANGTIIVDALPTGLEFVEDSTINQTYGWYVASTVGENNVVYATEYLKSTTIDGFDKENATTLSSAYVQIECKVSNTARAASVLTNVAEIYADEVDDRDSTPGNNEYVTKDYDASNYTGDNSNKSDLTDEEYYYKGREDDDDFEKVEVEGKSFDLSLQKFVSKINNRAPATSREPVVDVAPLKNGGTDAKYTTYKTPLVVEKGDVLVYTIRVYNEGEMAGYAESVADYLPEGLGFLVDHTVNVDNYWAIPTDSKTIKLSEIENGKANLSLDDFKNVKKLDDVNVVAGKVKLTSTKLKSSETDNKNLIEGFDKENSSYLKYKDIQVACIVLADEVSGNNFKNIAEIIDDSDINREEVDDRDSTPDTVNPDNYPGNDKDQDDNDYENLATDKKEFDLSLQKFITAVNNSKITNREPKLTKTAEGKITFAEVTTPVSVANNDLITYTIRVYNEGTEAGYAKEIMDDLPAGLEFVKDNEINKKYGWKLYDNNGNETSDLKQAVSAKTDYLSKEKSEARKENCLLNPFNKADGVDKVDYRDVQIVFKVVENAVKTSDRVIVNTAEITDDSDKDGNSIDDVDSTPNNNKKEEDDLDDEKVDVKYFDLSLKKDLVKIIITENGTTREIAINTDQLQKVEVHRKRINSTVVKFVYNITVKNEGEIAGYATEIKDYIPEGLEFIPEENTHWTKGADNTITTNALADKLLKPGETASVQVTLKWINNDENFGVKTNVAEISKDKNDSNTPDIDSTPDNKKENEDDIDNAPVMLVISTGIAPTYIGLTMTVLMILSTGIILIKKYVL